ncbi:MAG: CDP-diacylglycerol--serine O-phosphatidyltransferase [Deltaproteobacteria bacterium]|nr:MAG: CDP-diacylglycerol--serine O-phosphatidyltransferase [Deltaproteobacteria bacterium]
MVQTRQLKFIFPNLITAMNIACGFFGILLASQGRIDAAIVFIFFAGIFDMLDGKTARLLDATSEFGIQFDSFSDALSFGMAPAYILYQSSLYELGLLGMLACLFFLLMGVIRLTRFNIYTQRGEKNDFFYGFPIPASAAYLVSFILMREYLPPQIGAIYAILFGLLMVSNFRLPNFKNKNLSWKYQAVGVVNSFVFMVVATTQEGPWPWRLFIWWNAYNLFVIFLNYRFIRRTHVSMSG